MTSKTTAGIIMTGRCVLCGTLQHRVGEAIADGEVIAHSRLWDDDEGLCVGAPCDGEFVSVMGRTRDEVDAAVEARRAASREAENEEEPCPASEAISALDGEG